MVVEGIRSKCERLFEHYCEERKQFIDWVYKNGELRGSSIFPLSIWTRSGNSGCFYPDYIVRKKKRRDLDHRDKRRGTDRQAGRQEQKQGPAGGKQI